MSVQHEDFDRDQEPLILTIHETIESDAAIKKALHQSGYRTIAAEDGATGIIIAEKYSPHAVLLDAELPGMDACVLCEELKSRLPTADIPILFLTSARPTNEAIQRCFDAGAHDLITKPKANDDEQKTFLTNLQARLRVVLREQALREAYRMLAIQDIQTGLENRRQCFLRLGDAIITARREKMESILILGDIDKLGAINDRFGYDFGDEVILTFARLVRRFISPDCKAARIGGNTLAVILKNSSRDRGVAFCRRIAQTFGAIAFDADSEPKHVTVSFGLSSYDGHPADFNADRFMYEADVALFEAKDREQNRVCAYWDLPPQSLPAIAPQKRHARRKERHKSNRAYLGVPDAAPEKQASDPTV